MIVEQPLQLPISTVVAGTNTDFSDRSQLGSSDAVCKVAWCAVVQTLVNKKAMFELYILADLGPLKWILHHGCNVAEVF